MLCPPISAEIDTTTRMHRENTMRQFNYSLPLGINIMGNWAPFLLNIIWSPTNIGRVIAAPVPDTNCWFYAQNINEYVCHNAITSWQHFFKERMDTCDAYTDSNGVLHQPTYIELVDEPLFFTFDAKRICYSGQRYYKAPLTLLPDGAICRPECDGGYDDSYSAYYNMQKPKTETKTTTNTISRKPVVKTTANKITKRATTGCSTCGKGGM